MTVFLTITILLLAFYLIQSLLFCWGLTRLPKRRALPSELPFVSVIVAARNEEANIARTLDSLVELDYPRDRFEVIISDGASTDRTPDIVEGYAKRFPFVHLHRADQNRKIRGKANAVHQAVERSKGDFIFLTDADCIVQNTWIKETLRFFTDDVGLVCGLTIPKELDKTKRDNWFSAMQSLDWCYILGVSSGRASIGFPIGGIGNNFTFRKQTYQEIGGYENIKFSITEDFALFQAILKSRWKIVFPTLYETHNFTEPMQTAADLYAQKKRWTLGGLDASAVHSFFALLMFLVHLFTILAFFFLPIEYALATLGIKFISDMLIVLPVLIKLRELWLIRYFLLFELYYYAFVFLVPVVILFSREVQWKGVSYDLSKERAA
jgi:cellulose synthase/poly-beta-1,6-N-acetylglucosamine synthase-like glycosyltransferase